MVLVITAYEQILSESKGGGLMRQGQQNRRNRGRGRNNRSNNPLSRNYESNGPEVKIKGSAAHIAEKYMTLARDALSSGNTVTAENYFQHAEHYNRIIQAAQAKQEEHAAAQASKPGRSNDRRSRQPRNEGSESSGKETPVAAKRPAKTVAEEKKTVIPGTGEQPSINGSSSAASESKEEKPKRKPRPRKPKIAKVEGADGQDVKDIKDDSSNAVA
jgi:hypothetical protein